MTYSIIAEGLAKRFGDTVALDGVDLAATTGSVLGLLGPNGAGKTTAVRILTTLVQPDAGRASVGGYDVVRQAHQVRQLIGLAGQYASVDDAGVLIAELPLRGSTLDEIFLSLTGHRTEPDDDGQNNTQNDSQNERSLA